MHDQQILGLFINDTGSHIEKIQIFIIQLKNISLIILE